MRFIPGTANIFSSGYGYAAVWDVVSRQVAPLWQYRARVCATATVEASEVQRTGRQGVLVPGSGGGGFGNVALCIKMTKRRSRGRDWGRGRGRGRSIGGSTVLLLNGEHPSPLLNWRLQRDVVVCMALLLGGGGREGVVALTKGQQLLLLTVPGTPTPTPPTTYLTPPHPLHFSLALENEQNLCEKAAGVIHMAVGAQAPMLSVAPAAGLGKRRLLEAADLSGLVPSVSYDGGKRLRLGLGADGDGDGDGDNSGEAYGQGNNTLLSTGLC
ncbi:unnamed protein product [Choristocarpus tenellus]